MRIIQSSLISALFWGCLITACMADKPVTHEEKLAIIELKVIEKAGELNELFALHEAHAQVMKDAGIEIDHDLMDILP